MRMFVGVDPGMRKNGTAACIIKDDDSIEFKVFKTFQNYLAFVDKLPEDARIVIENSNLTNANFGKRSRARNVGKSQGFSHALVEATRWLAHLPVMAITPKEKGKKLTEKEFRELIKGKKFTKYKGSQDERDAYKCAEYCRTQWRLGTYPDR